MAEPGSRLLLLAGVPATGKSTFAGRLHAERGYFKFVLEEIIPARASKDEAEVWKLWQEAVQTSDASRLVKKLRNLPGPVVVEWGFPINQACIRCVESMKQNGMRLLWFECPDDVARDRFVERATVPVAAFDIQMPRIRANYDSITALGPEIVDVISPQGMSKTVEEIEAEIGLA